MSQRLSCLSSDFGLHLIRTISGFFSSVFVCQRYGTAAAAAAAAAATAAAADLSVVTGTAVGVSKGALVRHKKKRKEKEKGKKDSSLESGVDCDGHTSASSSRSSSSSSISGSLRYSTSSCELVTNKNSTNLSNTTVSTLNPPTIVLTTPSGHRHEKNSNRSSAKSSSSSARRSRSCKSAGRSLASRLRFSTHIADFCNFHSDNDELSEDEGSSYDDEDFDMELPGDGTGSGQNRDGKVKVTEKELTHLNHKIVSLHLFLAFFVQFCVVTLQFLRTLTILLPLMQ